MSTDTRQDLDIIEALDFEYTPPCESEHHANHHEPGPAYALVHFEAGCHDPASTGYRCRDVVEHGLSGGPWTCSTCWKSHYATMTVIAMVK